MRHLGRPVLLGAVAAACSVLAVGGVCRALDVQITTVRAADHGPSDAQLVALRPRLRRLVGYRSFQIVREERRQCQWQEHEAFKIPGGRLLHVVPKGMRDQEVVLEIRLIQRRRPLIDTDVRLQNHGVMLLGVDQDPRGQDGALLIMLRAEE